MPNIFQRMGAAIGRVFGREQDVGRVPIGPLPGAQPAEPERRGLGERIRNIFQPGRAERERLERELSEAREAREVAERQAAEARAVARQEREARETAERQVVRPPAPAAPQLPPDLRDIPPVLPLGPKGRDGAAYTTAAVADVMSRLQEAAALGKRVSLRVHDENGWHDLFLNPDGPGRHKAARGMTADYLMGQIGDDFDAWVDEGCETDEGGGYEDELGEVDRYQLTVWS
jgi:hypothetical protein